MGTEMSWSGDRGVPLGENCAGLHVTKPDRCPYFLILREKSPADNSSLGPIGKQTP